MVYVMQGIEIGIYRCSRGKMRVRSPKWVVAVRAGCVPVNGSSLKVYMMAIGTVINSSVSGA